MKHWIYFALVITTAGCSANKTSEESSEDLINDRIVVIDTVHVVDSLLAHTMHGIYSIDSEFSSLESGGVERWTFDKDLKLVSYHNDGGGEGYVWSGTTFFDQLGVLISVDSSQFDTDPVEISKTYRQDNGFHIDAILKIFENVRQWKDSTRFEGDKVTVESRKIVKFGEASTYPEYSLYNIDARLYDAILNDKIILPTKH